MRGKKTLGIRACGIFAIRRLSPPSFRGHPGVQVAPPNAEGRALLTFYRWDRWNDEIAERMAAERAKGRERGVRAAGSGVYEQVQIDKKAIARCFNAADAGFGCHTGL